MHSTHIKMEEKKFSLKIGDKELIVKISQLAEQANGAVMAQLGQTVVLATCVMAKTPRERVDYLPLTVDYEERFYASGKIKGSRFVKREGRPPDEAFITDRLIDRAIRPCFNQKIRQDIQVMITVLSYDGENDPDILSLVAASLALSISDIPWDGPIAGLRIGQIDNNLIINPTNSEREKSNFDLLVASKKGKINMLEIKAKETDEKSLLKAIEFSQPELKKIIDWQEEIRKIVGLEKMDLIIKEPDLELIKFIKSFLEGKLEEAIYTKEKIARLNKLNQLKEELIEKIATGYQQPATSQLEDIIRQVEGVFEEEVDRIVHQNILQFEKRPDGRKLDQIREISCQVSILPRTHGSALFIRGTTQALSVVTLGSPGDEQYFETMKTEGKKHFMHHYNFPPYCVGEAGPLRGPGRREIGHGALAEKSLEPLIPSKEEFPYTIRVVSEILSSNGSSSMASVSASSLSLMDAGVPIKKPTAGIALGLMMEQEGKNYKILTDIQGPEDHHGDMDLKVAGTADGMTSAQMDVKIEGLDMEILKEAFSRAKKARLEILDKMNKVISKPRSELSPFAPRIFTLQINPERIRDVIGPGGKIINQIIEQTGVLIDIEDTGLVFITSPNKEAAAKAISWIENLTREVKIGEVFQGRVTRILDFGALVEILPDQVGLVHISELAPYRVDRVTDIVKVGDIIPVKVKNIDDLGRINLSLKETPKK